MSESEMVERVAKAIAKAATPSLIETVVNAREGGLTEPIAEALARAAIEAMREPTEPMIEVLEHMVPTQYILEGWRDMIDAALKKEPTS